MCNSFLAYFDYRESSAVVARSAGPAAKLFIIGGHPDESILFYVAWFVSLILERLAHLFLGKSLMVDLTNVAAGFGFIQELQ